MSSRTGAGVPLCDLQAQYRQLKGELEAAAARVLASGQVILGPEVDALEREIAEYCGVGQGVGCASGTDALLLGLQGIGVQPGDEVILPPFTFFATAEAVCRLGARPVFADIDPVTFNIDHAQVEKKITDKTRAVIAVHLFGQCADMEPLWHVAEKYDLPIVEDAAQALGAEYQRKRTGSLGAVGCFSFYPSKILGAYGDAGMVVTSDPEWAEHMSQLRVHGMTTKYYHDHLGWNSRLDALQAALLRVKVPHLDKWINGRQEAAGRYDALIDNLELDGMLTRPTVLPAQRHVFNQYVVRVADDKRDELAGYLRGQGIGCEIYYPVPLHLQKSLAHLGHGEGDFPVSEEACRTVLALPMFPEITEGQQRRVIEACADCLRPVALRSA